MEKTIQAPVNTRVSRQTLFMAVLVSLTLGFVGGAAYTSFKLAGDPVANLPAPAPKPAMMASPGEKTLSDQAQRQILDLEMAVKKNPEDVKAWVQLGNLFFDANQLEDAIRAYEKSLELAPGDPRVLTDLGVMYRRNQMPEKAIQAFDRAIAADSGFETARFNKGIVLMHDLNDLPAAVLAWKALVKINPDAVSPGGESLQSLIERLEAK
jgi:cytochrome c-type biogenesis protein CcmH/NrfG